MVPTKNPTQDIAREWIDHNYSNPDPGHKIGREAGEETLALRLTTIRRLQHQPGLAEPQHFARFFEPRDSLPGATGQT